MADVSMNTTGSGICACGCGRPTPPYRRTFKSQGMIAGEPSRYLRGHRAPGALNHDGYRQVRGWSGGRKLWWHRWRAEVTLGKSLPPGAEVHHANGTKGDDSPLVICQDRAYHMLLHMRMRIKALGGHPDIHKFCPGCQALRLRTAFGKLRNRVDGLSAYCLVCARERNAHRAGIV